MEDKLESHKIKQVPNSIQKKKEKKSNNYFNMPIQWAYMYILQPKLCVGKSMAMQVIDLT